MGSGPFWTTNVISPPLSRTDLTAKSTAPAAADAFGAGLAAGFPAAPPGLTPPTLMDPEASRVRTTCGSITSTEGTLMRLDRSAHTSSAAAARFTLSAVRPSSRITTSLTSNASAPFHVRPKEPIETGFPTASLSFCSIIGR